MRIQLKNRLKRLEREASIYDQSWFAIIEDDVVKASLYGKNNTGSVTMTREEFEEWKESKPEGHAVEVEYV